jgi:uncharacterized protein (TIGR00369 family)
LTEPQNEPVPASPRTWPSNPFIQHLHLPRVEVGNRAARLEFVVEEIHLRHGGIVHGGMYATVLDTVTGHTAYSIAPNGTEVVTIQLSMNMTATAKLGDRIIATGQVVHSGRRTAVVQGELRRSDGKLLATGSTTIFFVSEGIAKSNRTDP